MKAQIWIAIVMAWGLGLCAQAAYTQTLPDTVRLSFKRFVFRKHYDSTDRQYHLDVLCNHIRQYRLTASKASHLQFLTLNEQPTYDINGDSLPEVILQRYLSDAQETIEWHILTLRSQEAILTQVIRSPYTTPVMGDADRNGVYEIYVRDYTFGAWNTHWLASPLPLLRLEYTTNKWQLAASPLATAPLLPNDSLAQLVRQSMLGFYDTARRTYPYKTNVLGGKPEERWGFIHPVFWRVLLDLYYMGKAQEAKEWTAKVWYESLEGQKECISDFEQQLRKSPYWHYVRQQPPSQK